MGAARSGAIRIRCCSSGRAGEGFWKRPYSAGEIDAIGAYCPHNGRCYDVPIERVGGRELISLRLAPARNNQAKGILAAAEHELGAIAQLGERRAGSAEAGGSSPPSSTCLAGVPPDGAGVQGDKRERRES